MSASRASVRALGLSTAASIMLLSGCASNQADETTNVTDAALTDPDDTRSEATDAVEGDGEVSADAESASSTDDDAITQAMLQSMRAIDEAAQKGLIEEMRSTPSAQRLRSSTPGAVASNTTSTEPAIGAETTAPDAAVATGSHERTGSAPTERPVPQAPPELTTPALAAKLVERMERESASLNLEDAMTLAALRDIAQIPRDGADPLDVLDLAPSERRAAEAVARLRERVADSGVSGVAEAIEAAHRELLDEATLDLTAAELCTSVEGFGRYSPIATRSFLAGQSQPAILYVEVDHFRHQTGEGESATEPYRVALRQELMLYHDADGLLAWRKPAQDTRYDARRPLRDYYVVTRIDLPASLTVGRYHLKVVMTDLADGATAERVIPIDIVGDRSAIGYARQ